MSSSTNVNNNRLKPVITSAIFIAVKKFLSHKNYHFTKRGLIKSLVREFIQRRQKLYLYLIPLLGQVIVELGKQAPVLF